MPKLSFISANYVARIRNYDGNTDWGVHDQATVAAMNADRFAEVARDAFEAGFEAIDIWMAHCHWKHHAAGDYLEQVKGLCSQFDLSISSYAGGLHVDRDADLDAPFRFMKQLGAPMLAGGLWGGEANLLASRINDICAKYGVKYAFENHPETSAEEILRKINYGRHEHIGIALDTGWCGTQGIDAVEALKRVREKLFIVHLKDVTEPGKHNTCALGEGIVGIDRVCQYLKQSDYRGVICIEHEPYDRDPMPEIRRSIERIKGWL